MADRKPSQSVALHEQGFSNIIRYIKRSSLDRVEFLEKVVRERMAVLQMQPDESAIVSGIPEGSDQSDMGSFLTWMNKIQVDDVDAGMQLTQFHATAKARLTQV